MKYQIFISYRRTGGEMLGKIIFDRLTANGYRVFYDVESMRSGLFNKQLYNVIDECDDFLLLLSPNALDRCFNDGDWVREEILHALEMKKNIIPVMMNGFHWPSPMPDKMEKLPLYEGLTASTEYWDAVFDKLCHKLLKSQPKKASKKEKYPVTCHNSYPPSVLELLETLDKQKLYGAHPMDICSALRHYFTTGLSNFLSASSPDKSIVDTVISKYKSLPSQNQEEIRRFFTGMDQLEFAYDRGKETSPSKNLPLTYQGNTYFIEDIFEVGPQKYIVAYTYPKNSLPHIHLFMVDQGEATIHIIEETSSVYNQMILLYGIYIKMLTPHIPYIDNNSGVIKKTKIAMGPKLTPQAYLPLQLYQYYKAPSLFASGYKKGLLGIKETECIISLDSTSEAAPNGKPTNFLGLNKMQAIDIINMDYYGKHIEEKPFDERYKTSHMVFFLEKNPKSEVYTLKKPLTTLVINCNKNEAKGKPANAKIITTLREVTFDDLNTAYPSLARRIALKLECMKRLNLIEN